MGQGWLRTWARRGETAVPDGYSIIADVSETLKSVLEAGFTGIVPSPPITVHNLRSNPSLPSVTLFLFDTQQDASSRNRPRVRVPRADGNYDLRKPVLPLQLRYLITPWINDDGTYSYPYTDHVILGRVMQTLYDRATLSGADLKGGTLANSSQALHLTLFPMSIEDQTRIWNSLQKPYRMSVVYEVRVVNIAPELVQTVGTVRNRVLDFGDLEEQP